jgi:paraquat-inducible protein A
MLTADFRQKAAGELLARGHGRCTERWTLVQAQPRVFETSACHACGLIQQLPQVADAGAALLCSRCGGTLRQVRAHSVALCAVCAGLGLVLFGVALYQPLASVLMQGGRFATTDLLAAPEHLRQAGAWLLTWAVLPTMVLLPLSKLITVGAMALALRVGRVPGVVRRAFAELPQLSQWSMIEVFLLGAMIALFRLREWMLVDYGPALFALSGAALCSVGIDAAVDRDSFWRAVPLGSMPEASAEARLIGCRGCDLLVRSNEGAACPRCGCALHFRKPDSVARTWAFLSAATLLAVPANVWPVMTITQLGRGGPSTIVGGTFELLELGFWGLATLVFVASVVVPLVKLGALSFLLVSVGRGSTWRLVLKTRVYRVVALIGRWSMIDIFATMMLAALARFGWLGNVRPEAGAAAFCGVVVLTMLASESFDPRLLWDAGGHNGPAAVSPNAAVPA